MSKFNHYRPRYDVVLVVLLVAIVSIAGLFIMEIENPRLSHFPSPETHAAAREAGARVTPSKPEETRRSHASTGGRRQEDGGIAPACKETDAKRSP